jgi:hypothetical protein
MTLALTQESSLGLKSYNAAVRRLAHQLEEYFRPQTKDAGIETVLLNLVCVAPDFAAFFAPRKPRYTKGTKTRHRGNVAYEVRHTLEYDVVLEYATVKLLDADGAYEHLMQRLVASITTENYRPVPAFPVAAFQHELATFLGITQAPR